MKGHRDADTTTPALDKKSVPQVPRWAERQASGRAHAWRQSGAQQPDGLWYLVCACLQKYAAGVTWLHRVHDGVQPGRGPAWPSHGGSPSPASSQALRPSISLSARITSWSCTSAALPIWCAARACAALPGGPSLPWGLCSIRGLDVRQGGGPAIPRNALRHARHAPPPRLPVLSLRARTAPLVCRGSSAWSDGDGRRRRPGAAAWQRRGSPGLLVDSAGRRRQLPGAAGEGGSAAAGAPHWRPGGDWHELHAHRRGRPLHPPRCRSHVPRVRAGLDVVRGYALHGSDAPAEKFLFVGQACSVRVWGGGTCPSRGAPGMSRLVFFPMFPVPQSPPPLPPLPA